MSRILRLSIAQLNPTLGDLDGNRRSAAAAAAEAAEAGSDVLILPEMFLAGYPLQDLAFRGDFLRAAMASVRELASDTANTGVAICVGAPILLDGRTFNALHVLENGVARATVRKHHLPNAGVFDEPRTFHPGPLGGPVAIRGVRIGFAICEDFWRQDVAETLAETGAELLVVVNGSPYERDKHDERIVTMVARTVETGLPLAYVNLVGGQDDQVYDGGSFVLNRLGHLAVQGEFFEESLIHTHWEETDSGWRCERGPRASVPEKNECDYRCLVRGLGDFARKNGFDSATLGLSGGVDSALAAAITADALGPERLHAVMLPSRFTSEESKRCAEDVVAALRCTYRSVDIEPGVSMVREIYQSAYGSPLHGTAGENVQARMRGLLLMAIANTGGRLLIATGNKSEMAVGYATLYGDMCGGYACLKDVYKTRVYDLARWRNANHREWMLGPPGAVVPEEVLARAPSAELRAGQRDDDSLPPYPVLDGILEMLVEQDISAAEAVEAGFDPAVVAQVEELLRKSEFKRFQAPPGPKITRRAFWLERRYPITNQRKDSVARR